MKHTLRLFILTSILQTYSCYSQTTITATQDITTNTVTSRLPIYIVSDSQTYTSGGLTFTYPTGLFTVPPLVQVSVQPTSSHPSTETYGPEISVNSATSTTVMVYLVNSITVSEAPNGSVIITIFAVADQ